MVRDKEKEARLKELFKQFLKSGKEEDLFNLRKKYEELLGPTFSLSAKNIGGGKVNVTVSDGRDTYSILRIKPRKKERAAIVAFSELAYSRNKGTGIVIALDPIHTTKHSRNREQLKKECEELGRKYEQYRKSKSTETL